MATIDAVESLISFINDVKPYHTKIVDVLIEYVHAEDVAVTISEEYDISIEKTTDNNICQEAFGTQSYGVLSRGGQRFNPYYDQSSLFYNPVLDSSSELYDITAFESSPPPSSRELAASITFIIFDLTTNENPYYDPTDSDYNPVLDINSSLFDPLAYGTPPLSALTVSIPYVLPSPVAPNTVSVIPNPFYDVTSSEYDVGLDNLNEILVLENYEASDKVTLAVSFKQVQVLGAPLNPFYDPVSVYYNPLLDRNAALYDPSANPSTIEEQAASVVFLPFIANLIESNWNNNYCNPQESDLTTNIDETLDLEVLITSTYDNDFHLLYDVLGAFNYQPFSIGSPSVEYYNAVAVQEDYAGPALAVVAKVNATIPTTGRWYWEFEILAHSGILLDEMRLGLMPADGYNLPFGPVDNNQLHLGELQDHYGQSSRGFIVANGIQSPGSTFFTTGDVVGIAYDTSATVGNLVFYKNNVLWTTSSVTNIIELSPAISADANNAGNTILLRGSTDTLLYAPPIGYSTLSDI